MDDAKVEVRAVKPYSLKYHLQCGCVVCKPVLCRFHDPEKPNCWRCGAETEAFGLCAACETEWLGSTKALRSEKDVRDKYESHPRFEGGWF